VLFIFLMKSNQIYFPPLIITVPLLTQRVDAAQFKLKVTRLCHGRVETWYFSGPKTGPSFCGKEWGGARKNEVRLSRNEEGNK